MTQASIIVAAISVMTGSTNQVEIDTVLGNHKTEIISQVQKLEGSKLSMIKETVDILSQYNLDIELGGLVLAENRDSRGVSYSTDPQETVITK